MADLVYYLTTCSTELDLSTPESIRSIVSKIVASHLAMQADFIREIMVDVEIGVCNLKNVTGFHLDEVEGQWAESQALARRTNEACEFLESILLQLRIPFEAPDTGQIKYWEDYKVDFQYLYLRFKELRHRAEMTVSAITGLAGMAGNRQAMAEQRLALQAANRSNHEARSARALTLVGLVFIPLAFTASLFSMADTYRPGQEQFGVYFAVALPFVILVISTYYVVHLGYTPDGSGWSIPNIWARIFGKSVPELLLRRKKGSRHGTEGEP